MKKTITAIAFVFFAAGAVLAAEAPNPTCDGTPQYGKSVMESYRKLQFKTSVYENIPEPGKGIRLGIYQAQAACGEGAGPKNMARLERAVEQAKTLGVQLLSFPELYVPGYTLSPKTTKKAAEYKDGPSITKGCEIARKYHMALLLPYAEKVDQPDGSIRYYDSIAKYYGHTHPEPAYNYLKDRRPESYRELLAPKVNFMKGGYIYPHYQDGMETSAR